MITIIRKESDIKNGNNSILELRGLSTDTKPTENISNSSIFIEIDTGDLYMYDAENEEWNKI